MKLNVQKKTFDLTEHGYFMLFFVFIVTMFHVFFPVFSIYVKILSLEHGIWGSYEGDMLGHLRSTLWSDRWILDSQDWVKTYLQGGAP